MIRRLRRFFGVSRDTVLDAERELALAQSRIAEATARADAAR